MSLAELPPETAFPIRFNPFGGHGGRDGRPVRKRPGVGLHIPWAIRAGGLCRFIPGAATRTCSPGRRGGGGCSPGGCRSRGTTSRGRGARNAGTSRGTPWRRGGRRRRPATPGQRAGGGGADGGAQRPEGSVRGEEQRGGEGAEEDEGGPRRKEQHAAQGGGDALS